MKRIVLIGDSIRTGYQDKVRELLAGRAEVCPSEQNAGTSALVLAHLDEWAISLRPDVVHVNCGLHDIKKEFGQDTAAIPLGAYERNVRAILERLQAETEATVIWATTTPVNQEWHHANKTFDRFEADVVAYNKVALGIAGELGIAVDDLYSAVMSVGADSLLTEDGVHFTPEGCRFLGERVAECIKGVLGGG
jgi:lysophospholipase L1-like esterase